jgi:hypothetical protein
VVQIQRPSGSCEKAPALHEPWPRIRISPVPNMLQRFSPGEAVASERRGDKVSLGAKLRFLGAKAAAPAKEAKKG